MIKYMLGGITLLILMAFANCSDVKISKSNPGSQGLMSSSAPKDSICAPKGATFGAPVRVIVVIDMSMSNLGSLFSETNTNTNQTLYWITNPGATDLQGNRFLEAKKFIENCGGGVNVRYSVIGFASSSILVKGQSCSSEFESQPEALRTLDLMKQLQDKDQALKSGGGNYPFYLQDSTMYNSGLGCLKNKIDTDLTLLNQEKPSYQVFFMTDGQPTDPLAQRNYADQIRTMDISVRNNATSLSFQPVFYTSPGAKNQGTEQNQAIAQLDVLARAINPSGKTIVLSDLSQASSALCSSLQPDSIVNYKIKSFFAVNLTAKMKNASLYADSDMDGLTDQEESQLGWSAVGSRSTSVLDGLCHRQGLSAEECETRRARITCDPTRGYAVGLSECDVAFAGQMFGKALNGYDSDQDLIPDFVEIVRDTSPARADSFENPSGDGVTNYEKITSGLDVNSNLSLWPVPSDQQIHVSVSEDLSPCSQGEVKYNFTLDRLPLVPMSAFTDQLVSPVINLSHKINENVILLYTRWHSFGGIALRDRLYVQKFLVSTEGGVTQDSPQFLGEL